MDEHMVIMLSFGLYMASACVCLIAWFIGVDGKRSSVNLEILRASGYFTIIMFFAYAL